MLVPGDLGFRVAVFVAFVVFPAIGFVLRRKWRLAVARQHEINRLLLQASEEAARVEAEAQTNFCYSSSISIPAQRLCAVCFTPTPNRCARCKSVNYCSGKCQIIHWRQGHKDECRPSLSHSDTSDEEVSYAGDAVNQFYNGGDMPITKNGKIQYDEQVKSSQDAYCPPKVSVKDEKGAIQYASRGDSPGSQAEFHSTSELSQMHASSADGAIEDSNSDIDSIHDLNSESCSIPDSFETSDNNVVPAKPLEENAHLRVSSNGNISSLSDLKEGASGNMTSSSGPSISRSDKNLAQPTLATSGFWDGSLEYCKAKNSVQSSDVKPYPGEMGDVSLGLQFQGPEKSADNYSGILSTSELVAESSAPIEKDLKDPTRHQRSTVLASKEPVTSTKVPTGDGDPLKPVEVGAMGEDLSVLPCASKKSIDLSRNQKDGLHLPVSKKVTFSPKAPNGVNGSLSCTKDPTASTIKSVKAGSNAAIPSHVARSAPSASVGLKTSVLKVVEQFRAPRLPKESDGVGRNSEKAVFSYESFVKLYHWKVELRPCGLINCGNSCYANVILQCLTFTPPITAYLLEGLHSKGCAKKDWCFVCEFERLVLKAKEGGPPPSPIGILSQIQKIGSHLSNGRQEDAHEFLRYVIDTMQSTCLREAGVDSTGSLHEETTLMGLTFGGYLRSKIKCTKCRGKSEKQERMMDLTVEIGGDIETLEDALRQFTGTEPLDGENKYQCGRCKSYEKAKKKLNILEAPNILTIALKRFQSGKFGKLNKAIRFPEILNLAPYMRGGSDKSPIYQLYGVVVHLDTMNAAFSGHYICYVRNAQNKWYKIDDSTVKAVELDRVLNKGAYMLFYSRISPRAPRSIRSALVSRDVPSKIKIPEVDISRTNTRSTTSRQRGASVHANSTPDNLASLGHIRQGGASLPPVRSILDDSSSDNSSIFSTDSNRESVSTDESTTSTDDFSEYIFGPNAFYRHSDSDTSTSSSSSSSPEYTRHSPLSNLERYASALPSDHAHSVPMGGPSCSKALPHEASRAKESGSVGGVSFLHSNSSSKQGRKLVNISSREADAEILGRANPLDNGKSGVYQRRSLSKKSD